MVSSNDNREKLRRLLEEVVPVADYEALSEYVHEDVALPADMPGGKQGLVGYKEGLAASKSGIEYTHSVIDTVAEGDKVVARVLVRGRQIGDILGIANSGKEFQFEQMVIAQFRDGRVSRFWRVADLHSLRQQLEG
jgi:predicted ester cyclase